MEKKILENGFFKGVWLLVGRLSTPSIPEFISDYWKSIITIAICSFFILSIDFVVSNIAKFLLYGFGG